MKSKGVKGGAIIKIQTEEVYNNLVDYLNQKFKFPTDWNSGQRRNFKRKAN